MKKKICSPVSQAKYCRCSSAGNSALRASTTTPVSLRLPWPASPQDLLISGPSAVVTGTKATPGHLNSFSLGRPPNSMSLFLLILFQEYHILKKQDRRLLKKPIQKAIFRCFLHLEEHFVQPLPTEGHLGPQPEAFLSPESCPVIGGY